LSNRILLPMQYEGGSASSTPDHVIQNFVLSKSCLPLSWNLGRLRSRRFMTVVLAPLMDRCERVPRWGRYCVSCQPYDFECWDIHTLDSMEEHLLQHESGGEFPKRIPLDFGGTWDGELQFNKDWPYVEKRLVSRWDRSFHRHRGYWTHEEILARWDGYGFKERRKP
jgi:hypothetical protein